MHEFSFTCSDDEGPYSLYPKNIPLLKDTRYIMISYSFKAIENGQFIAWCDPP